MRWLNTSSTTAGQLIDLHSWFSLFPVSILHITETFPISVYFKKEAWVGNGNSEPTALQAEVAPLVIA